LSERGEDVTRQKSERPAFEKEVIRLPDGRELTYYRFPEPPERAPGHEADSERRSRRMSLDRSEQGARGSRGSPSDASGNRGSPDKKEL
jgi:hypothetical protein